MSRTKEKMLVIDTETCNSIEQPLPYDIGYAICDRDGKIYLKRSFIVAETFLDMQDVMKSAYYANKIPAYWDDIKSGKRIIKSIINIRKIMFEDMKNYNVKKVGAYNMGFDKRALNNVLRYATKSRLRWFFPFGTEYFCIWNCACDVLLNRTSYINFAIKNGFISEKKNIQTSAENAYRYITNKVNFVESHTGLEDVEIEVEILAYCYKQHKKMDTKINKNCWQKVQKKRKEMGA